MRIIHTIEFLLENEQKNRKTTKKHLTNKGENENICMENTYDCSLRCNSRNNAFYLMK